MCPPLREYVSLPMVRVFVGVTVEPPGVLLIAPVTLLPALAPEENVPLGA